MNAWWLALHLLGQVATGSDAGNAEVEASALTKAPKQTKFVEAAYPSEAQAQGMQAEVDLLLEIDEQGHVRKASLLNPAQPVGMGFDEAAIAAALLFEFEPAEMDGTPVAVELAYRYRFILKPKSEPAPQPKAPVRSIAGRLVERGTREPLAGVTVVLYRNDAEQPLAYEAQSDARGEFWFDDVAPGTWNVRIDAQGYETYATSETVTPDETLVATYYLERQSYNPYDVLITASRPKKEVNRITLERAAIERIPGAAGDPLVVVQNLAGVGRPALGTGDLIVRGSAPEDTKVLVDGIEVPLIYHFGGVRSVVPLAMVETLDFYPGNFASPYGRATGGLVELTTKRLAPERVRGSVDVSILDAGLYLEAPIGDNASIAVAGRRSYLDAVLSVALPSDAGIDLIAAPRYYDYQLLASYRPAPAHALRFFFFGSDDRFKLLFDNPTDLSTQAENGNLQASTGFYRSILSYDYIPSTSFKNELRIASGQNRISFSTGNLMFDLDFYTAQVRDRVAFAFNDKLDVAIGTDIYFQKADITARLPRPTLEGEPQGNTNTATLISAKRAGISSWAPGLFLEFEARPLPSIVALPGVRVDYFEATNTTTLDPRLALRHSVLESLTLKSGLGVFHQLPAPDELDTTFGNPDLRPERAVHYSLGAEWQPLPGLSLDTTAFYKVMDDLVSRTSRFVDRGSGPEPMRYDDDGVGKVKGVDLVLRQSLRSNLTGWLAYTFARSERRDSGATAYRLADFDQTHILTLVAGYQLPANWEVGGRFRYVSGKPYTPVVSATFNNDTDRYDPVYGRINSERLGPFHQLDVRVDKRFVFDNFLLNAYLDLQNVYNYRSPESKSYSADYRKQRAQRGLPILPIIGLKAEL